MKPAQWSRSRTIRLAGSIPTSGRSRRRPCRSTFTLIKFDSRRIEKVCVAVPVSEVAELTMQSYQPGASTPLIDAAYKTIKAVEKSLKASNPRVVVCIQTDGHENASTEHTWDELNALIKEKTAAGWQFNFLGTGIDAYDTGARMGVAAMSTMSSGRL